MYFIVSSSLSYYFLTAVWVLFSAFSLVTSDVLRTGLIVTLPTLLMALRGLLPGALGLITGTPKSCHPEALLTIILAIHAHYTVLDFAPVILEKSKIIYFSGS
jgi:hypothetical protein